MTIIQLKHSPKLAYPGTGRKDVLPLPAEVAALSALATVVTFRPPLSGQKVLLRTKLDATMRLNDLPDTDLVFYSVESDSPLAPLLLWDAVHNMKIGRTVTMAGDLVKQSYLLRTYFSDAFELVANSAEGIVLRKTASLPAEKDRGRNAWSFCIPVGPEDATLLNVVVRRILELDVPEKEIILCGRPASNFRYLDQVRIVGEDITAPPVQICAKKNRLVQEARYENVCILHDRVFLPRRFHEAVAAFGECFPLTTFQSLYFDDRYNLVPRRYSDFGTSPRIAAMATLGVMRNNDIEAPSPYSPSVLALTDKVGFFSGNALRYSPSNYPTGSLYLVKRSVWLACPQDENLMWTEFEDLEQAGRAEKMGIPSRINPHALTQSLIARPLLTTHGAVFYESHSGVLDQYRPTFESLPIPRKPLIKMMQAQVRTKLAQFEAKYVPEALATPVTSSAAMGMRPRLTALVQLTHRVKVPLQRKALSQMIEDYEKMLVLDQLPYAWREDVLAQFLGHGNGAIANLVAHSDHLINHSSQRPKRSVFVTTLSDYLPKAGPLVYIGSFIAALTLMRQNRKVLYFPKGFRGCLRSILDSTPYSYYVEKQP
jgi:hypothetical protein